MEIKVSEDEGPSSRASMFISRVLEPQQPEASSVTGGFQMSERGSIRRVPKDLREGNEEQFTPRVVSIGPIHASDARLSPFHKVKNNCCSSYVIGLGSRQRAEDCYKELEEREKEAREFYVDDEVKHLGSEEFLEMMFIDGCFILHLLLEGYSEDCYVPRDFACRDVFLLENQIPFLVLSILFKHAEVDLVPKLKKFLVYDVQISGVVIDKNQQDYGGSYSHLLDFAWQLSHPRGISRHQDQEVVQAEDLLYAKSISELALYGIECKRITLFKTHLKFKRGSCWFERGTQSEPPPPLGIKYKDRVLMLPRMIQDNFSTTLWWNFLAYEQQPDFQKVLFFQSFIVFLSTLIKTENDFKLLEREHIIDSGGIDGSAFARLVRDLSKNIRNAPDTGYVRVIKDMNDDCKTLRAYLVRNYYDARWDVLQSFLLFILTVTQTIYAVLTYKQEGKKN